MILRGLFIITLLPLESLALSPFYSFRHLYEQTDVSPSPSPSHGVNGESNFQQYCNRESRSCQLENIAACLIDSQIGPPCLFVQNNGENPLHVTIMILSTNNTIEEINLTSHQMQKINISSDININSAIALNSSNGDCIIHAAAPEPENHHEKYTSYVTYITPINGAYLLILLIIIGIILTFFKLRIRGRHLDGVPYHELEMGNSTSISSSEVEENENEKEKENWDQDWDDEWGDEKPVKSDCGNVVIVEQVNGLSTNLPNVNGRKKEWDD